MHEHAVGKLLHHNYLALPKRIVLLCRGIFHPHVSTSLIYRISSVPYQHFRVREWEQHMELLGQRTRKCATTEWYWWALNASH